MADGSAVANPYDPQLGFEERQRIALSAIPEPGGFALATVRLPLLVLWLIVTMLISIARRILQRQECSDRYRRREARQLSERH